MAEGISLDDLMRRARLVEVVGQPAWSAVREAFPGQWFDRWTNGLTQIVDAGLAQSAVLSYARGSPIVAKHVGVQAALSVVPAVLGLAKLAGMRAALGLLAAAPQAARRMP